MTETSTTDGDNSNNSDAGTDSTTTTEPTSTSTDNQPGNDANNLDDSSKSTDTDSADDDKKSADDKKADDASASTELDSDLEDWIKGRGLTVPETEEGKQALQDLRNEQRDFTRSRQADKAAKDAKALGDEITTNKPDSKTDDDDDADPLEKRVKANEEAFQQERTTRLQSEFYTTNSVTPEQHKTILEIFKEKVAAPTSQEGKQKAFDLWSSPDALTDLLDLAKARLGKGDDSVVADEAARKERERIARESQATSPGRGAKTSTSGEKTEDQKRLERFSNWD